MSIDTIIDTLTTLATTYKSRVGFNKSIASHYKKIGSGAFRIVFDAGTYVIKVRRSVPCSSNPFPIAMIHAANKDERDGYEKVKIASRTFAKFVCEPHYFSLPNGHDVIIMEKVEVVYGQLDRKSRKKYDADDIINDQMTLISEIFVDGHWNNIGIRGNRAYLIDVNMSEFHRGSNYYEKRSRNVLRKVGVKFPGRKPKTLDTMVAVA
jgi:hypothetical protein